MDCYCTETCCPSEDYTCFTCKCETGGELSLGGVYYCDGCYDDALDEAHSDAWY